MLTEAEKGWLELRDFCKALVDRFYCLNCQDFFTDDEAFETVCLNPNNCPITTQDFRDTAEFEARVAALLAKNRADGKILRPKSCSWYETTEDGHLVRKTACTPRHDIDKCAGFATCSLYHARLAVEAEMDA